MSGRLVGRVLDGARTRRPVALLVLVAIAEHCRGDDPSAWPSISRLSRMTRLTRRSVMDQVHALESSGDLAVQRSIGRGNRYTVTVRTGEREDTGTGEREDTGTGERAVRTGERDDTGLVNATTQTGEGDDTRTVKNRNRTVNEPHARAREDNDEVDDAWFASKERAIQMALTDRGWG